MVMAVGCYAQKENLYNEAYRRGRQINGAYLINNTDKKKVTVEEMALYLSNKGYIVCNYNTQYIKKFLSVKEIVYQMEFMTKQDYLDYVFYFMSDGSVNCNDLRNGTFFQPHDEKQYEKHGFIEVLSSVKTVFWRKDNVKWTGSLSNGLLHGSGKAFWVAGTNEYHYIEGTFEYGFPTEIKTSTYIPQGEMAVLKQERIKKFKIRAVTKETIAKNANTSDSKMKQAVNLLMGGSYDSDVALLETAYKNAKRLSSSNYSNFKPDPIVAKFVHNYGLTNNDPKKCLPKAKAIKDAYYVCAALQYPIQDHYYGVNNIITALTMSVDWLSNEVKGDRDLFTKGLNIAKNGKNNDRFGFRTFYSQAVPILENKIRKFENKVASDRRSYNQRKQTESENFERIQRKLSKEIDWNRSKSPSGKLSEPSFFSSWGKYEKEGEIYFKSGSEYVKYNTYYFDNKRDHYKITYASSGIERNLRKKEFKTESEMVEAIVNAVR